MKIKSENERKKEFLWSYKRSKLAVSRAEEELLEVRINKMYPSVINDGMPHGSDQSDLSGYMASVDKLEKKIMKARFKRIQTMKQVKDRIEALLDEEEKTVLIYRYLRCMEWERISEKMHYSRRQVLYIHGRALKNLVVE